MPSARRQEQLVLLGGITCKLLWGSTSYLAATPGEQNPSPALHSHALLKREKTAQSSSTG